MTKVKLILSILLVFSVGVYAEVATEIKVEEHVENKDVDQTLQTKLEDARRQLRTELMNDPALFEAGQTRVYRGKHLDAIEFPVGGIGSGCLLMDGTARRRAWQIFHNFTYNVIPDSFFAIRMKQADGKPQVRTLQTVSEGPFEKMTALSMRGEYPFAWYDFEDAKLPAEVSLETYNPFIPLDAKNSAIPCAVYNITVKNVSGKPLGVILLGTQQNAVGYVPPKAEYRDVSFDEVFDNGNQYRDPIVIKARKFGTYGQNCNQVRTEDGFCSIDMTIQQSADSRAYGSMSLSVLNADSTTAIASWDDINVLHTDFCEDGKLSSDIAKAGPSPDGETLNGAIAADIQLAPGQSRTVSFLLTWHFPNDLLGGFINPPKWNARAWGGGQWGGKGNMYGNWWENASEVADYVSVNFEKLETETRQFHQTFYQTNLPHWLLDRISGQMAILKSMTCFWTKDNYFGGWEGTGSVDGSCAGNCSHVWHYAQAHSRLFPELARLMRQQELGAMKPDGMIPFRQIDNGHPALDAQCGIILGAYREHLVSEDGDWLKQYYPAIKKAMEYAIGHWDSDEDGWLTGSQHTTLDCALSGNSSWLGSMYAAALAASEKMALLQDDTPHAKRCRKILDGATNLHNEKLWNGKYFFQIPGKQPLSDYNNGCAIDQMLGQWWAWQVGLGDLYPRPRIKSAMASVFNNNFRANFVGIQQKPREFVKSDEAAMQIITWPGKDRPARHTAYADEVMSGFEYAAAANMLETGLDTQALTALKAISDRYDGRLRTGYKPGWGNLGYSGNPFGDDECGKFYSRSLSIYSVLLTSQGYHYVGPQDVLAFSPVWKKQNHRSFFTTATGWGLFTQKIDSTEQSNALDVKWGKVKLKKLTLAVPEKKTVAKIRVRHNEEHLRTTFKQAASGAVEILFNDTLTISKDQKLKVDISLK